MSFYVVTTEVAPHVRVSKTLDRVAHYARESRERRTLRRRLNKHAAKTAAKFNPLPRLVKPERGEDDVQVISLADFLRATPASQLEEVELLPASVRSFDKRAEVALQAGL